MAFKDPEARRAYHTAYMRKRYQEDPEHRQKHRARIKKNNARHASARKALVAEFKVNGCSICGEKEYCCLSAHHIDPETKDFELADVNVEHVSLDRIKLELKKCVCLCENCHRKVHAGILKVDAEGVWPPD